MYRTMNHLQYRTHRVHLGANTDTGLIQCFKYNDRKCEVEIFDPLNLGELAEYMIEPLSDGIWGFIEDTN